jgi:beta-glucosidase
VALADSYWEASMDDSDGFAAIPITWGTDAVHGHNNVIGATIFPHNIGLGAMDDPNLIEEIGTITAREVSVTGIDWVFGPTVAVVRDDRWGRTYEGYSEDPAIVEAYAGRIIKGLQGTFTHISPDSKVVATTKHYIGDGGTDNGVDQGDTIVSEEGLRTIHAPGYFSALEAGAQTVMVSFSSWNGDKMHGHEYLLNQVLKGQMNFDGFVVSDWNGIGQVPGCTNAGCLQAINAGIDMVMVPAEWQAFIQNTKQQVLDGEIPMSCIDDAVTRILRVKKRSGLFDRGKPSERILANDSSFLGSVAHRAVAREAVRKSLVLLKNKGGILPLDPNAQILVAGKSADNIANQCGGWTISWQGTGNGNADFPGATSIWQGINAIASNATLSPDGTASGTYDVAIVVIGETPYAEGQGDIGPHQTLEHARLHPEDLAVIQTIVDRGIPVVTIFLSGRPLYVNKELNRSDAFVAAWLPGTEGNGIADVLFGDYDFTGKLSYSWPGSVCQTPINVGDAEYAPLFPYGYGLTYADTDTLGDDLPGEERDYGCEQTDPGQAGTTDTPLGIFMNGMNVDNGPELGNYIMRIGGPSNWGGVDVAADPFATTTLPDGEVVVTTEDGSLQYSARRVVWNTTGQVYSQVEAVTPGVDLAPYSNSETSLLFNVKVNSAPTGNVNLSMHCEYPCGADIPFASALTALNDGQWHEVSVPLQCFLNEGQDISRVNTAFLIWTDGSMDLAIEEIRWEPWTAGPDPDCSSFGPSLDVIDDAVVYLFNNGLAEGYEFTNYLNDSSAIVADPDGSGGQVWSATLTPGTNVEIRKTGLAADMSAYDTPTAQLAFDIRIASVTSVETDILVKVDSWPDLSDLYLFGEVLGGQPAFDTWIPVSISIQELLASDNSLNPGSLADISEISDMFILESVNGDAEIYVRNVRWEDPELISNGTFDDNTTNWGFWAGNGGSAQMGVEDGVLNVAVDGVGAETWTVQVTQGPIELFEDLIYHVSFDAWATVIRSIEVILENDPPAYYRYFDETILLGETMQHYEYEFTMETTDMVNFKFLLGNVTGADTLGAHEIFIDNVSLRVVPEPGTLLLIGAGFLGMLILLRRSLK